MTGTHITQSRNVDETRPPRGGRLASPNRIALIAAADMRRTSTAAGDPSGMLAA